MRLHGMHKYIDNKSKYHTTYTYDMAVLRIYLMLNTFDYISKKTAYFFKIRCHTLQSQEILNRPVFVLEILKSV